MIAGLAADDTTVVGVIDDPVIVVVGIGTVIYTIWHNTGYLADQAGQVLFSKHGGQSDKKLRKGVETEVEVIRGHEGKISNNPNSPWRPDWGKHIKTALANIAKKVGDMGPKMKQDTLDWLKQQGIDITN